MTKIFISHSSKDTDFAKQLAHALAEVGISTWMDVSDIPAGMKWSTAIQNGLKECEAMIVILSPDSMASTNVEDEWQYYLDKRKQLFPVRWKPAEVHFQLNRIQYIDFHEKEFGGAFVHLCDELRRQGIVGGGSQGQIHVIQSDNSTPTIIPRLANLDSILPSPFEWAKIPGGNVTFKDLYSRPEAKRTVFEISSFLIAKYPITKAQYRVFLRANDGYDNTKWWNYSEAARRWRSTNPKLGESPQVLDDHPHTNISWYEAVAYSRWLTARIVSVEISLPTEQQWQRAAIADTEWVYPWGNKFEKDRSNVGRGTLVSNQTMTTPVTQYPNGASPFGVVDMYGNVAEWCLNNSKTGDVDIRKTNEQRRLRGGSWNWSGLDIKHRDSRNPYLRYDDAGFRIVALST